VLDYPPYPTASHLSAYYKSYATHFDVYNKIIFNVSVSAIRRCDKDATWLVYLDGEEKKPRMFDKVVVATGSEVIPKKPVVEGLDKFEGQFLHSQGYKRCVALTLLGPLERLWINDP
jgi:dimethylaniline monooxygenase (N-oxide forming) / hypotaurine monooxygenase